MIHLFQIKNIDPDSIYNGFCSTKIKIEIEFLNRDLKIELKKNKDFSEFLKNLTFNDTTYNSLLLVCEKLINFNSDEIENEKYLNLKDEVNLETVFRYFLKQIQTHLQAYHFRTFLDKNFQNYKI